MEEMVKFLHRLKKMLVTLMGIFTNFDDDATYEYVA